MVITEELLSLGNDYPTISIIIGILLFIVGFKFAKKIMWGLSIFAIIIAIVMFFL